MRLVGREKLAVLNSRDQGTATWVANWIAEIRDAHWKRPTDVTQQFPRAQQQDDGSFVFPLPRRKFGVCVLMAFPNGIALIVSIKVFEAANGN